MAIQQLELAVPDLGILRMNPCSALTGPHDVCGATPASLYRRVCGVIQHTRQVWLCPVHAALAASGMAICKECAERGGMSLVLLERMTEPVRL